jgi:hypothetical protein
MNAHSLARLGNGTGAKHGVFILQAGRGGGHGHDKTLSEEKRNEKTG